MFIIVAISSNIHGFDKRLPVSMINVVGKIPTQFDGPVSDGVRSSKAIKYLENCQKEYEFRVDWSKKTSTGDSEGLTIKKSDLFPLETIILPPYLENDLNDTPSILWENSYQSSALTRFLENSAETDIGSEMWWKKWVQSYLACVAFVDHQVGVILDGLENSQYADNTIVIFTAD